MILLTSEQKKRATEALHEYLTAPANPDGRTPREVQTDRDTSRVKLIEGDLKPLLRTFLDGTVKLAEFKSQVDGINKRNAYWGFQGIKGQMFFNMVTNVSGGDFECEQQIREAIALPDNEDSARNRIAAFGTYTTHLGERHVAAGGSKLGRPKRGSIPFFLSYFWQIQDRLKWPVYYTNSVNTLSDLNVWLPTGEMAEDYVAFKRVHEELARVFAADSGEDFGFYEVEHVLWFKGGNPTGGHKPVPKGPPHQEPGSTKQAIDEAVPLLPDSFVPPVVAALPSMARNDSRLQDAARNSGTSLERALEKSVDAAFTILGFDTKLLGQGQGRVPDGVAMSPDDSYAILWDAKAREKGYSMGTDDRAIREYVTSQSRELKRKGTFRNIYYAIVSSCFSDDFDNAIRSMKMETHVNEVVLVEADALVMMVDAKLRDPRGLTLGPDGIQRLFSDSGVLRAEDVKELLG